MPANYKTKVCKQFAEEPFYCPYGEKCQFLHVSISQFSDNSNRQAKYSEILNETMKQMEKRLVHVDLEKDFQLPESVFKTPRLSIFVELTEN